MNDDRNKSSNPMNCATAIVDAAGGGEPPRVVVYFKTMDQMHAASDLLRELQEQRSPPETSGELERLRADNERLMHHVRKSPSLSNDYVRLAEEHITSLRGLLEEWFQRHGNARGNDGRLLHPTLDVDTAKWIRPAVKSVAEPTNHTRSHEVFPISAPAGVRPTLSECTSVGSTAGAGSISINKGDPLT